MPALRTSRIYSRLPDAQLSEFTGGTIAGFTTNPALPTPPVLPAGLTTLKTAFDNAIVAAASGGKIDTATRNSARVALQAALDKNASYVDINCDDDLTILLSSGYQQVSTNRVRTVLEPPQILAVTMPQTGQLQVRVNGDPNRRAIQGRIKDAKGTEFGPTITFSSSKAILFDGLTAGTTYVMQLIGIGGSTGKSDWSDPVSKIAL
ncbi:MAG: hypothetical protein QOH24_627 [Verrucomicrobiota bacterium]